MNIIALNSVHNGSTGNIMRRIAKCARENGAEVITFSTYNYSISRNIADIFKNEQLPELEGHIYYGSKVERAFHVIAGILTGFNGYFSFFSTLRLLRKIKTVKPDIIHLHNIHQYCINFPLLFNYINKKKIKVVWTFHDCWPITGHCAHFDMVNCEKWKTGCNHCPIYQYYPKSIWDNSKIMYRKKRELFSSIDDLTIVTPSNWLNNIVSKSYLKEKTIVTIHNGINLEVFKPIRTEKRNEKCILLGVASSWDETKGLDVFIRLAETLPMEKYEIIMVGTNETIDRMIPKSIISVHKTDNQDELAKIYSRADYFINPTREDTFPTVNIEALACGTPVITYDTGGSPEIIDSSCGIIIKKNDEDCLIKTILCLGNKPCFTVEACRRRAMLFNENNLFESYFQLYLKLCQANQCEDK